jgi:hypothetical protein
MLTPEFGRSRRTWLDRHGKVAQKVFWTPALDSSHRVDHNPDIERPIRSPDEKDMASGGSARWTRG